MRSSQKVPAQNVRGGRKMDTEQYYKRRIASRIMMACYTGVCATILAVFAIAAVATGKPKAAAVALVGLIFCLTQLSAHIKWVKDIEAELKRRNR